MPKLIMCIIPKLLSFYLLTYWCAIATNDYLRIFHI